MEDIFGDMDCILESFVLLMLFYWIFTSRVNTMVDIVANRFFNGFDRNNTRQRNRDSNNHQFQRRYDFKQRRSVKKERDQAFRDKYLFDLKENCISLTKQDNRPLSGLSCYNCCPNSQDSLVTKATRTLSLVNLFSDEVKLDSTKYDLFLQKVCRDFIKVYGVKKYDYPRVEKNVLKDPRLQTAIERTAMEQFQDINSNDDKYYQKFVKNNEKRAYKLLYDMRSTLSDFLLRFTSWVLYKLLPLFLNSVVVHPGQIEMLNNASQSGLPMIFIPLHRSHLDYIMVSFILLNNDIRSPLVAAGDNLRIPFFGSLLRGLGAFYIKRRIDPIMGRKDLVYKAVLHTYMNECLRAGHNIEFFLEGGRTRTGKPCMPKYGIFSVIIDAFMDGTIEDALLVPISMNYEKLIDGNFVREQLGEPKEMETFGLALKSIWKILNSNYGMMRIDFNQPFSLRELINTFDTTKNIQLFSNSQLNSGLRSRPSTTSLYGTDVVAEEQKQLVQCISKHVLFDCVSSTAIMSTNALAFLLLNKFRKGGTLAEVTLALDQLRSELLSQNRDLGFTGESVDVVQYAAELLGCDLVQIETVDTEEIITPVTSLPNVIELAYYSNCLMQIFSLKSIVALALNTLDLSTGFISKDDWLKSALELCDIMQFEFLFCKPCQTEEIAILNIIDDFIERYEILKEEEVKSKKFRLRGLTEEIPDDEFYTREVLRCELKLNDKTNDLLKFFRNLLRPWIEPYCVTADILKTLVGVSSLESEILKAVLTNMKKQYELGTIVYGESVCADPIKNALKLFQHWDILEVHPDNKARLLFLREQYDNVERINEVYDRINKFREIM